MEEESRVEGQAGAGELPYIPGGVSLEPGLPEELLEVLEVEERLGKS